MFPYLSVFALLALFGLRDFQSRTLPVVAALTLFLIWFAGMRFYVGCDYHSYVLRYNEAQYLDLGRILRDDEFGFGLLTALFSKLGAPFTAFQAFVTAIILATYAAFASRHRYATFLLALFFPVLILQLGMSGLRQAAALGFILLAYNAFIDGRRLLIGFWILVAFLFHNSAIILLPMAFIAGREISLPRLIAGFVVLAPVAAFLLGDRIEVYSDRYIEQIYGTQESGGAWLRYAFAMLPAAFFLLFRRDIKSRFSEVYQLLIFGILFGAAISITALISTVALHRLTFFVMPLTALMALYVSLTIVEHRARLMIMWLGIFGSYLTIWFLTSRHATVCYTPYQNVIFPELTIPAWALIGL